MAVANIEQAVSSFEKTDRLVKKTDVQAVRIGRNYAAIQQETLTRIAEDEVLAIASTILNARLGDAEAAALVETMTRASQFEALSQATTILTARIGGAEAGLIQEASTRSSQDQALAQVDTALSARLTTAEGGLSGQAGAIQSLQAGVSYHEGVLVSHAYSLQGLQAYIAAVEGGLGGQATALSQLTTRVTSAEGNISAQSTFATGLNARLTTAEGGVSANAAVAYQLQAGVAYHEGVLTSQAQSIQALSTTQGGHTATLTQYGASINGIHGEFGVAIAIDNTVVSGYRLVGFRRLDGSFGSSFNVLGDIFASGSITGDKLAANNIITVSGQIGTLLVDNIHIKNRALTATVMGSSPNGEANIAVTCRETSEVTLIAVWEGSPGTAYPINAGAGYGVLRILRDGQMVNQVAVNWGSFYTGSTNRVVFTLTVCPGKDSGMGEGDHVYTAQIFGNSYNPAANIHLVAHEASK